MAVNGNGRDNGNGLVPGRTRSGKFAPGNKVAKGITNNNAKRMLLHALVSELNSKDTKTNRRKLDVIVQKLVSIAMEGDIAYIREVLDRVMGKPKQHVEGSVEHSFDLTKLSDEELSVFESIARKATTVDLSQQEDGSYGAED